MDSSARADTLFNLTFTRNTDSHKMGEWQMHILLAVFKQPPGLQQEIASSESQEAVVW